MIEFKNVTKTYKGNIVALKNINLEINKGEFIAIIGLSGAGKSTLLRTINRMHEITEGTITYDGKDISKYHGKDLQNYRHHVGMVFQSFNLIERTSAFENVITARAIKLGNVKTLFGIYKKTDKLIAFEALEQVGLAEKSFSRVDQLSGGQKQRVALARTVAQKPGIILADEPVASLDPITARKVMNDFKKINVESNITILANMHHVEMALEYATRVIGIKEGEIVFDGETKKVNSKVLELIYGSSIEDFLENEVNNVQ